MNEAFERRFETKMEFIVEQQAQFAMDIRRPGEKQDRTESIVGRPATVTLNRFQSFGEAVSALVDAQVKTEDSIQALAERMRELAGSQRHTDRRLNALMDIVRDEREGKS